MNERQAAGTAAGDQVLYGWDSSHYDGELTREILADAASEGISFFTHKIGEGGDNTDPTAPAAFAAARDAGIRVIGGYYFIHPGDMIAQADRCIALADEHVSWWRDFDGWFWQADAEDSSSGLPSPAQVKQFSDHLASETGRVVMVYASAGQYGNRLSGLGHKLWNANYGTNPHGAFKSIYPGDASRGWNSYSGQTPELLQYTSNATIAGLTTCDANAFRGTIDDLLDLIGAHVPLTPADAHTVISSDNTGIPNPSFRDTSPTHQPPPKTPNPQISLATATAVILDDAHGANVGVQAANAVLAGLAKQVTALTALLQAGGGNADTTPILQAIRDEETAIVTALQQQVAALSAKVAALQAALAKGAADVAADLAAK